MSDHPYTRLPQKSFWAPSVGKLNLFDISELWSAPFPITKKDKIATFGSCFAQHFSRALVANGFSWLNAEPAPEGLDQKTIKAYNYNVFSARTANIYTTSLLLQWVEWALGEKAPPEIAWERDGRIIDPFRPTIEPEGFASVDEMLASRNSCIEAFRRSILECNIFVFTLGLTESWWDKAGDFEYPICPGTTAGDFDEDNHIFLNQDYEFSLKKLRRAIKLIRNARPKGPRIILTVSPVPLVATNSENHVLVATTESKSILRAVAGKIATSDKGVSYFPSYEIINAAPFRATFFEPNMRSVNLHGVNHVMKTFFAGLPNDPTQNEQPRMNTKGNSALQSAKSDEDIVCEEELLGAFGDDRS